MSRLLLSILVAASAVAVPAYSFAQSSQPVTRAEVRADLVRVEQAGYSPARGNDINYPADIQAAEAKVAAAQDAQDSAQRDMGGVSMAGTSAAGSRMHTPAPPACVGPASFCTPYFGS
ncbi:DUF4148 domain-containing protein [Paraburkholderia silvatlantica]|uniref:DUF4148 domain-containing protein n=1 Tax=Paraburkholderia silvatlantica TaxID=321895 RepID=A0ABR6FXJ3_9BURK|nr:DUF4148 domain-containing protein [Paraburkholderia silvatlantica]MBB2931500.1 hypothetical protein [Paraburkholderia silvatlantica]PVY27836.1 uncharacterized protein DUF4148 [Paraburkholderia silvatlantica]PXW34683.1 uncharacterized protein DUF4148 [Paraburkholderia silvatlantica]TDQ98549.1 uncharacterized protein DUF4148 [Paraburkholderia silvatlantica]